MEESIFARRKELEACNKGDHAGLLLDRYLLKLNDPDSRQNLQQMAIKAISATSALYRIAFERHQKLCVEMYKHHCRKEIETRDSSRLIIGLGNASVLETGLTLHHTYGTPLIPGSALKGLCAHHASELLLERQPELLSKTQYNFIFGDTKNSGHIIFHDAWIVPKFLSESLKLDVMTPHHTDYYSQNGASAPTDFDSPTPVSFLSVSGVFEIILSSASGNDEGWLDVVWVILKDALEARGIGGKTSSGYGRMMAFKN